MAAIEAAEADARKWAGKQARALADIEEQIGTMEALDFDAELRKFDDLDQWRKSERVLRSDQQLITKELEGLVRDRKRVDVDIARAKTDADGSGAAVALQRLDRDLARARVSATNAEGVIAGLRTDLARFEEMLLNPGEQECKTCGQELSGTDHLTYVIKRLTEDRDNTASALAAKESELEEIVGDIASLESDITALIQETDAMKQAAGAALKTLGEQTEALDKILDEKQHALEQVELDIKALGARPQSMFDSRDEVYAAKHAREALVGELERERNAANPYTGQVEGLKTSLQEIDMEALNDAHDLLRHQDFLFKLLTSKDSFIRRKIIEQNLSYLNNRLNHYLGKLGLPHDVVFQSDLSVEIMLLGRDYDFAQLSRGEGNRVIMATSWAFRDVWESLNHRVNLMWIDELLDSGVDATGAEAGLQILKGFVRGGRNIFLISHRDELVGRIDRTLVVSKENGFTSIGEEV